MWAYAFPPGAGALWSHVTGLGHPSNQADFTYLCPVDRGVGSSYLSLPSAHRQAKTDKLHLSPEQTLETQNQLWKSGLTRKLQLLSLVEAARLADSITFPSVNCVCRFKGVWNRLKQSSPNLASPTLNAVVWAACFADVCRRDATMSPGSGGLGGQNMKQQGGLAFEFEVMWENAVQQ